MTRAAITWIAFVLFLTCTCSDAWSRGGGRGGGGGRPAGRSGGGAARTPSMSRAAPHPQVNRSQVQRPQTRPTPQRPPVQRPQARPDANRPKPNLPSNRPNVTRPNVSPGNRPEVNRPTTRPGNRPNLGNTRPSPGDLNDFLDMPGRPQPLPGGGARPGAGTLPAVGARPGVGLPSTGERPNLQRPDFSNRPNIGQRPSVGQRPMVPNRPTRADYDQIRNRWSNNAHRPFGPNWWGRYPTTRPAWHWHSHWGRYPHYWCWRHAAWPVLGTWFVWSWNDPIAYNYGTNVVYRDNYVYVNDQQVATTEAYYEQAATIAESVPEDVEEEKVEWMPLGVFAIAEQGGIDNGMLIQLAVSKEGIIAGTFYNDATDEGRPVEGMVDKDSQRTVWQFADGKNTEIVMETTIYNLTQDESTALVHFGKDKTQSWLMVRLPESEEEQ